MQDLFPCLADKLVVRLCKGRAHLAARTSAASTSKLAARRCCLAMVCVSLGLAHCNQRGMTRVHEPNYADGHEKCQPPVGVAIRGLRGNFCTYAEPLVALPLRQGLTGLTSCSCAVGAQEESDCPCTEEGEVEPVGAEVRPVRSEGPAPLKRLCACQAARVTVQTALAGNYTAYPQPIKAGCVHYSRCCDKGPALAFGLA